MSNLNNPWSNRPAMCPSPWFLPGEAARIGRHNSRVQAKATSAKTLKDAHQALRRLVAPPGPNGAAPVPTQWAGNPWEAPILLLLMNPSWGAVDTGTSPADAGLDHTETGYKIAADAQLQDLLDRTARGAWDPDYPNPFLHPAWRKVDTWHPKKVFANLHSHLTGAQKMGSEDAWKRLAQRVCVLEISPWASLEWTSGCIGPTSRLAADLAQVAMDSPDRLVLVGRGGDEWRKVGLLDVDLLESSRGIRSHQVRISQNNFPNSWGRIISLVT